MLENMRNLNNWAIAVGGLLFSLNASADGLKQCNETAGEQLRGYEIKDHTIQSHREYIDYVIKLKQEPTKATLPLSARKDSMFSNYVENFSREYDAFLFNCELAKFGEDANYGLKANSAATLCEKNARESILADYSKSIYGPAERSKHPFKPKPGNLVDASPAGIKSAALMSLIRPRIPIPDEIKNSIDYPAQTESWTKSIEAKQMECEAKSYCPGSKALINKIQKTVEDTNTFWMAAKMSGAVTLYATAEMLAEEAAVKHAMTEYRIAAANSNQAHLELQKGIVDGNVYNLRNKTDRPITREDLSVNGGETKERRIHRYRSEETLVDVKVYDEEMAALKNAGVKNYSEMDAVVVKYRELKLAYDAEIDKVAESFRPRGADWQDIWESDKAKPIHEKYMTEIQRLKDKYIDMRTEALFDLEEKVLSAVDDAKALIEASSKSRLMSARLALMSKGLKTLSGGLLIWSVWDAASLLKGGVKVTSPQAYISDPNLLLSSLANKDSHSLDFMCMNYKTSPDIMKKAEDKLLENIASSTRYSLDKQYGFVQPSSREKENTGYIKVLSEDALKLEDRSFLKPPASTTKAK